MLTWPIVVDLKGKGLKFLKKISFLSKREPFFSSLSLNFSEHQVLMRVTTSTLEIGESAN